MNTANIKKILMNYGITNFDNFLIIDSSRPNDYRLNIIVDKKYVLRINEKIITEERLESISNLVERYRKIGVLVPRLFRNNIGKFITLFDDKICYVTEYLDYETLDKVKSKEVQRKVWHEIYKMIGKFSATYTNLDLMKTNSMWSIIDLAPLDVSIDEKQENINELVKAFVESGDYEFAEKLKHFNEITRLKISKVYKKLPRCVIQGDLNDTNILVDDGKFIGLIDFNMAGTEVNINNFCCETNELDGGISLDDLFLMDAEEFFRKLRIQQEYCLNLILESYELNDIEKSIISDYRKIVLISQYPNVCFYKELLKTDKMKLIKYLQLIMDE